MGQTNVKQEQLEWRRSKVQELAIKGFSQSDISRILSIPKTTINRDVSYLKIEAEETIKNHIQKTLPFEYQNCLKGLQEIIKESWIISAKAEKEGDTKEKSQSLALIKECYSTKMDLLTNAGLLQESIRFVESTKEKLSKVSNNGNGLEGFTETNRTEQSTTNNTIF
jgi:hypothetical protein